ncbi:hypothetical protein POVCU2_0011120 [Plasmodium ovale curtisi]|uniref:Uncharacterized protein n=1 Tax=Plasmodium ovale curtisi TaxID=864141 RepID=A0A1A8VPM3_PLAOA|nr:hypothetical protein POVCU2_0011120 [Plasmodium ovale curtisi]
MTESMSQLNVEGGRVGTPFSVVISVAVSPFLPYTPFICKNATTPFCKLCGILKLEGLIHLGPIADAITTTYYYCREKNNMETPKGFSKIHDKIVTKLRQNCDKTATKLRQICDKTATKLRQNCDKTVMKTNNHFCARQMQIT